MHFVYINALCPALAVRTLHTHTHYIYYGSVFYPSIYNSRSKCRPICHLLFILLAILSLEMYVMSYVTIICDENMKRPVRTDRNNSQHVRKILFLKKKAKRKRENNLRRKSTAFVGRISDVLSAQKML